MQFYSYAGTARGRTDPDEVHSVRVNGDECAIDRCHCDHDHYVLMWSGQEYSKHSTWISAHTEDVVSLETNL